MYPVLSERMTGSDAAIASIATKFVPPSHLHSLAAILIKRALLTETKVESGTSHSKSGTSVNLSNSGIFDKYTYIYTYIYIHIYINIYTYIYIYIYMYCGG